MLDELQQDLKNRIISRSNIYISTQFHIKESEIHISNIKEDGDLWAVGRNEDGDESGWGSRVFHASHFDLRQVRNFELNYVKP